MNHVKHFLAQLGLALEPSNQALKSLLQAAKGKHIATQLMSPDNGWIDAKGMRWTFNEEVVEMKTMGMVIPQRYNLLATGKIRLYVPQMPGVDAAEAEKFMKGKNYADYYMVWSEDSKTLELKGDTPSLTLTPTGALTAIKTFEEFCKVIEKVLPEEDQVEVLKAATPENPGNWPSLLVKVGEV